MGRHSKAVKLVGGVRGGLALLDDDERRRVIEASERDIDDGVGFFRGQARPDTALMATCIDEYGNRFKAGPIARSCPKRWTAVSSRRAATACSGQGPSAACGRGMRRRPATSSRSTRISSWPCTGTARRTPGRWRGAGIRPRSAVTKWPASCGNWESKACATTMDTRELPLQALEQAISWAASHGGTDGLVHHSDHGAQYISLVYTTRVGEFGMLPSTGTVGDSYDNAMAESADGAYRTELV